MDNKTLIDTIAGKIGKSREEVMEMTDALGIVIADTIKDGDTIAIPSVGTFEPKLRAERIAVHPSSGKRLLVPPKLSIYFKPSTLLKQKIR
jgi:hypothetical protein